MCFFNRLFFIFFQIIMDVKQESPGVTSSKIIDQTKKSGEFDKYRHELANNIIESSEMQKLIEKCKGIIEETLISTSDANLQKFGIAQIRETVRGEIKKRKLVDNMMNRVLNQHMQKLNPILSARMEELVRTELGMPKEIKQELPDANLELIDMEVSSGGSGQSSAASSSKGKNNSHRNRSTDTTSHSSVHSDKRKSSSHENQLKIDVEFNEDEDASTILDRFADSISSSCSSSLSCNASEDGLRPEIEHKSVPSSRSSNKSSSTQSSAKLSSKTVGSDKGKTIEARSFHKTT